jgi:hypothetical protein
MVMVLQMKSTEFAVNKLKLYLLLFFLVENKFIYCFWHRTKHLRPFNLVSLILALSLSVIVPGIFC